MPRLARIAVVNVAHHVTQRGNARQFILANDDERKVYLSLLRKYVEGGWGANKRMSAGRGSFLIVLTLFFIAIVFWLAVFPPSTPRVFLNQRRAVQSIGNLNLAEHEYAVRHPDAGFACDLSNFGEQTTVVDQVLASGTKSAYHFDIRCPQGDRRATAYTITAVPVEPGRTGEYALCTDQSGEIWYSENGSPADCLTMHKPVERKYK